MEENIAVRERKTERKKYRKKEGGGLQSGPSLPLTNKQKKELSSCSALLIMELYLITLSPFEAQDIGLIDKMQLRD